MGNIKGCGAFTGEMAVEQMKDMGITNVLIGHSERRGEFGLMAYDTNETLATKLKYILDAGLTCVYCIGTGLTATPEAAQETHKGIRDMIKRKAPKGVLRLSASNMAAPPMPRTHQTFRRSPILMASLLEALR